MPVALLDLVEGDLDDGLRDDDAEAAVVADRRRQEVGRQLRDLLVGEARVGLADVAQALAVPNGERVVREDAFALSVTPLDGGDHDVEGAERALHLQPLHTTPAGPVGRARVLHHEPLVASLARRRELAVQSRDERVAGLRDAQLTREEERTAERKPAQDSLTLLEGVVEEATAVALEDVEDDERGRELRA